MMTSETGKRVTVLLIVCLLIVVDYYCCFVIVSLSDIGCNGWLVGWLACMTQKNSS